MKRCGLYVRVASEVPPNTLETQVDALKAFVNSKRGTTDESWEIAQIYRDNGKSGNTTDRPGYQKMLSDVRAKRIDILLCIKFDRLGRSFMNLMELFRVLEQHEIELISLEKGNWDASKLKSHLSILINCFEQEE